MTIHRLLRIGYAAAAIGSAALFASAALAELSVYPTGVTRYDPAAANNSYVLFDGRDGKSHLIDMDGNEIHTWNHIGFPSLMLDPAVTGGQRGDILVQLENKPPNGRAVFDNIFNNVELGELSWSGKVIWRWGHQAPGGAARQNHDWARLANSDTLVVATVDRRRTPFERSDAGNSAATRRTVAGVIHDQVIYEIDEAGKIVWQWSAAGHLKELGVSAQGLELIRHGWSTGGGSAGFLTINSMKVLGPNRWYRQGDRRFVPDNILIGSREANIIAIIDKKTGRIVWRTGPYYPAPAHGPSSVLFNHQVPRPLDQTIGQHDPNMIPDGLPGAGDILVLDNEGEAGYPPATLGMFQGSRVLEINPETKQIVWEYTGESSGRDVWTFDTSFIGSARRLPNGNTLICEGMNGRFIQVTAGGRIAWEYVNPHFEKQSEGGRAVMTNWVYRAQPIPYDWTPKGTPREEDPVVPPDNTAFHIAIRRPGQRH